MNSPAEIERLRKIAFDFAIAFEDDPTNPNEIRDVSELKHPKSVVDEACRRWIQHCTDAGELKLWIGMYPMLAHYQKGVGQRRMGDGCPPEFVSQIPPGRWTEAQRVQAKSWVERSVNIPAPMLARFKDEYEQRLKWVSATVRAKG